MEQRETIIKNYINAYNNFDVEGMVAAMSPDIRFENISGGNIDMALEGIDEFRIQAEQAKSYFSSRQQTISSIKHNGDESEITINYHAVLAIDFPNGMQKGDELTLTGRSVFKFNSDKITALTDIS